ncbi:hypothetical protein ACFRFH_18420 [Leifsonia sp. NPDC056824]|uniref:hypothetical protein n=1 Tax=Leifsonia sp. NPDC056824 TaxID=3345953 RepID=UPI0036C26D29
MIGQIIADLFSTFLGRVVYDGVAGRKRAKATERRVFQGGLRVVSGTQAGLGSEWLIGYWSVSASRLSLGTATIPIVETVGGSRRTARVADVIGATDTVIHTLRTETAELEWALLRLSDADALRALGVPVSR